MRNTRINDAPFVQFGDLSDIQEVFELLHHNPGPSAVTFSPSYRKFWGGRFVETTDGKKSHAVAPTGHGAYLPQYLAPPYPIPPMVPVATTNGQVMLVPLAATLPIAPPMIMEQPGMAPIGMYPPYNPYPVPPQVIMNNSPNGMIHNNFESDIHQNHAAVEQPNIGFVNGNIDQNDNDELQHGISITEANDSDIVGAKIDALPSACENGIRDAPNIATNYGSPIIVHETNNVSLGLVNGIEDHLVITNDETEESDQLKADSAQVVESNNSDIKHKIDSHNNHHEDKCQTKDTHEPQSAVAKPKPALWSQLFNSNAASANVHYTPAKTDESVEPEKTRELDNCEKIAQDQFTYLVFQRMKKLNMRSLPRILHLNPRGMNNFGNRCYMHSALQVLIHLPQFYYLLISFPERRAHEVPLSTTPILDALKDFSQNFHLYKLDGWVPNKAKTRSSQTTEFSIEAAFTVQTLVKNLMNHKMFAQGQQEDVEEFLFFILDSLHEELSAIDNVYNKNSNGSLKDGGGSMSSVATTNGDLSGLYQNGGACSSANSEAGFSSHSGSVANDPDEWISMGPKRRERIIRETDLRESVITDMFGGTVVSEVRKKGARNSCTMQRFFTMRIDIDRDTILSLKDALAASFVKEVIPGGGDKQQEITKLCYLSKLPETLILQLKLFVYNAKERAAQKLNKLVTFEEVLEIPTCCLSSSSRWAPSLQRSYKLFGVIYHHGLDANKGHYSAAIFHTGQRTWFQFDDAHVNKIELTNVLNPDINVKVPYLLIYRKFN